MGMIVAPWSGREIAAIVPSFEMAIGPSSGPSFSGNGLTTPASAFSQYQAPVPNVRTANNPDWPGIMTFDPAVRRFWATKLYDTEQGPIRAFRMYYSPLL